MTEITQEIEQKREAFEKSKGQYLFDTRKRRFFENIGITLGTFVVVVGIGKLLDTFVPFGKNTFLIVSLIVSFVLTQYLLYLRAKQYEKKYEIEVKSKS